MAKWLIKGTTAISKVTTAIGEENVRGRYRETHL